MEGSRGRALDLQERNERRQIHNHAGSYSRSEITRDLHPKCDHTERVAYGDTISALWESQQQHRECVTANDASNNGAKRSAAVE
eukprot:4268821-Prymnesium_polylepis.1